MKLNEGSLSVLDSSSFDGVVVSLDRVANQLSESHWLPLGHRFRSKKRKGKWRGGHNKLRDDVAKGILNNDALSEYIAISAPVHATDGWSLLGRAIHCLLKSDPYSALHLCYYAELRAAVSLLASQGIGVFDKLHCVVDSNGNCTFLEPLNEDENVIGTHHWTWLAFEWWAGEPRAIDLLRRSISPGGIPLDTWINGMNKAKTGLDAIGTNWLRIWGIDIRKYSADRDARNDASYWPNTINPWETFTIRETYQIVSDLWVTWQPTDNARFVELDRHLLRIILNDGYIGATQMEASSDNGVDGFAEEVNFLINNMGMDDNSNQMWRNFLTDPKLELPSVVRMADGAAKIGDAVHVVEVMSRAAMLLRIATGASAILLSEAGIDRSKLEFWIESIGTSRGFWIPGAPPDDLVELYDEVMGEVNEVTRRIGDIDPGAHQLWNSEPKGLTVLGECERAALWGLGL